MSPPPVEIVLSTRDGARFLPELLASLEAQTVRDFRLLVRDDGSVDDTPAVLERACREVGFPVVRLDDDDGALGPARSFARLLAASAAPRVMPCDQDDVWKPRKVEVTLDAMEAAEGRAGAGTPVLVHTDLEVVDADLEVLDESLWAYQGLRPETGNAMERVLVQNVVTGCAAMANGALLERALPVPRRAAMHDWWLALVAAAFGQVVAVPEATVAYRQHGANALGARAWSAGYVVGKCLRFLDTAELHASLERSRTQARAFRDRYADCLDPDRRRAVEAFAGLDALGFWGRRRALLRHGLLKNGLIRNLALLARV